MSLRCDEEKWDWIGGNRQGDRTRMPDLMLVLWHGLVYGALLSGLMVAAFIGIAFLNPEIWLPDYPPDIRRRFGQMSEKAKRKRRLVGVPVFLLLSGALMLSAIRFAQISNSPTFLAVFLGCFVMLLVFNAMDLVVLDWLLFVKIQPTFIVLPGTEGAEGYGDYGFHFRAFLKGVAGSIVASLIITGLAVAIEASVS